ncbi:MAG TPA: oligopeptidase B, partial [Flavobacteriales bacterium]|nr:oligopeptidase B [Flavobacteriales bacterium]
MEFPTRHVPPIAAQKIKEITVHGHTRHDAYYWMRLTEIQRVTVPYDEHTQEVIAHLAAENAYSDAVLAPVAGLRARLYEEIKGRIKETDLSVPYRENGYWYHHRYEEGKEYPVHVRRKDEPDAVAEDILNENELAAGLAYFDLADYEIDPNNTIVGYSIDTVGRRQYEIRFRDLLTGKELPD